ncbi:MAG TPA: tetratricopeptide repeat protein [Thermoplasmata archaeon]|nr:tetratricopeptide repeat protein [Thermoplasmata archaeon]
MGEAEFSAVPPLVDREGEMRRIRRSLETRKSTEEPPLLLVRGEAGVGKTRLIQEAAAEAARQGRAVVFATARAESTAPYHVWAEPLKQLGLGYVLEEAPPPRLLGLYVITRDGRSLVKVVRSAEGESGPPLDETVFSADAEKSESMSPLGGGLSSHDRGDRRVLVIERPEFQICAVVEGHEDEEFLTDLRALAKTVTFDPSGANRTPEQSLRALLDSGKYDGIDYRRDDPKLRQSRLFQNTALGLIRKAELLPLVMVFDDLQWADPSSLSLLQYVARNLRRSDAHLLGTFRVEEGSVRSHLRDALHRMEQEGLVAEIELGGLSRRDLGRLAESFLGPHGLSEPFLDLLWQETHGNPLIVREVLRGLEEEGAIRPHGATKKLVPALEELSIPHRVREAVRARLDRVPREDRRLLEAAATCGTRFTAAMVARLVGEAEAKVLNGFGTIAGVHGFLREGESGFAFDHPAVQEVLYEDMAEDVRRVYHREAAEWLELAGGPTEDVAEHLYRARDPRAVGHLRQAAETACSRYANAEAVRFCTEALELEANPSKQGSIFEQLGSVQELTGELRSALASFTNARNLAPSDSVRARITAKIGNVQINLGEYETAIRECVDALSVIEGKGVVEEALLLASIGHAWLRLGHADRALECHRKSLGLREKIGTPRLVAMSLNHIGAVYLDLGDFDLALDCFRRGADIQEQIADLRGLAGTLNRIGIVHYRQGVYDIANQFYGRSLEIQEKIGDRFNAAATLANIGLVDSEQGHYNRALEFLARSLEIEEKGGDQRGRAISLINIGNVHLERGDYDRGLEYLLRGLDIGEKIGDRWCVAVSLINIGAAYLEQDDKDHAMVYLSRALGLGREIGERALQAEALARIAQVEIEHDRESALALCDQALALATETKQKNTISLVRRLYAILHRREHEWEESRRGFEESLRSLAQVGRPFEEGRTRYEFGLMWKDMGESDRAKAQLSMSAELFERIGSKRELEKAREALRDAP